MSKRRKPEARSVSFYDFLAERLISKVSEQPITVEIQFSDGVKTFEIGRDGT